MIWYEQAEDRWKLMSKWQQTWVYIGIYTIIFMMGSLLVYSPFLSAGKSLIWSGDGRTQLYSYLVYIGRYLRQILINITKGKFSIPLFDLNISSGDDILGFLNGQFSTDPLLLLSAFVPVKYSEYLYSFLAILRMYLSGLSFLFLCTYFRKHKFYSLIASTIYCFSGYAIAYSGTHPALINPMITLPLLIVGTDKILKKEHIYLLVFATFYAALCGYYHLYMMTIMIGVYFLIRFFSLHKTNQFRNFIQTATMEFFGYVLGIGLSAIIFFPGIGEFRNAGRTGFSNYHGSYKWPYYRTRLLKLIAPPGSHDDMAFAAIVLFALVLLFFSKKRRSLKILTISAFVVYMTSVGGLIMNGFQYSYNRWTFGLVLVISFVAVEMLPELLDLSGNQQLICGITICVYTFVVFSSSTTRKLAYVLVGVAFLALTAMILMMQIQEKGKSNSKLKIISSYQKKHIRAILCLVLVIINVGVNGIYRFAADQGNFSADISKSGYEVKRLWNATEREMETYLLNNPVGRADSSSFVVNTSMVWRIPGILYYSSVANKNVLEFWNQIEQSENIQFTYMFSSDQKTIANTLLSTKYHIEQEQTISYVPYGYTLLNRKESGKIIYVNNFALPWGYTYDKVISYGDLNGMNGIEKQEVMIQAIALENATNNIMINTLQFDEYILPYEIEFENCSWEADKLVVLSTNATIRLNFAMPESVEGYVRLKGFNINGSGMTYSRVDINCKDVLKSTNVLSDISNYYYGQENYLFNLGYNDEERTSLTITFPSKGTFNLKDIELYALPMDNYPARVEALRAEPLENIEWSTNRLTGTVDLSKDKVLCVSVPYSKGWSAKVDGEKVEILRGNYMFMAIPLTAGHHDIEFNYFSPGLKLGIVVTIISWGIVICMLVYDRKKSKGKTG